MYVYIFVNPLAHFSHLLHMNGEMSESYEREKRERLWLLMHMALNRMNKN